MINQQQKTAIVSRKTIYLIRHGQTDFNLKGIVQGSGIDSQLNATGKNQAQLFYERHKNIPFQLIITSELKRTIETAAPFVQHSIPTQIFPEFNEINWGRLEGKKPTKKNHQDFRDMLKCWSDGQYDIAIEGGETPLQVQHRMQKGIEKLNEMDADNVLIVSHGRAMRVLLCTMLNKPLSEMDNFPHQNTTLYHLEWNGKAFELIKGNCVKHLG